MNITVEDLGPCRKLVRVENDAQAVEAAFEKWGAEYRKHGKVQGFRPGKAPRELIEKNFAPDIKESVKRELLNDGVRQAIKDHGFEVVETLNVEEVQFGRNEPFECTATLEVLPKFDLPEYQGIPIKVPVRAVTEEDVTQAIDLLRQQKATFQTASRPAAEGDIIVVNYKGSCEGKPILEIDPAAKGFSEQKNYWLEIKPNSFIPGFVDQLKGAQAGDKREVTVEFPADFVSPALAGKKGAYEVEVSEVKEKVLPALSDAFASQYGAQTLQALQEGVRNDLGKELARKKDELIRRQITEHLLRGVNFEVPESLLQQETRGEIYDIVESNRKRGVEAELIEQKKEEIFQHASAQAQNRLKLNLVLNRIAQKENLKVSNEEFHTQLALMAYQQQAPPAKFVKDLEKRGVLPGIHERMLFEKTLKFLVEKAKIEEQPAAA